MRLVTLALMWLGLVAGLSTARADGPVTFVENRSVLTRLEERGYGFPTLFGIEDDKGLQELYGASPAYRAIVDLVAEDIAALRADMKTGGRPLYELTNVEVGRVMDMRWLKTAAARFRLVGVVNRLDRKDFSQALGIATCGEVRLIYRLAYSFHKDGKGKVLSSRMPFNFNAVFDAMPAADGSCQAIARRWRPAIDEQPDSGWLAGGPLDRSGLKFRQLELNAQIVRFPSGQEPSFGGQASYLMRIFGIDGSAITQLPLENTPDTARLATDAALKAQLAAYVSGHVAAIDEGVYQIPEEFLARKIISFSTFGNARAGNHPFASVLKASDFAALDYSASKLVRSPEALIERLDNGSCQGCHQSGATAGFHFIGLDDELTSPLNRIEVGISPHFHAEVPRREAYVAAVAEGREPNRFRPLSFAPPADWTHAVSYEAADATMPCMMPEDAARFGGGWQCAGGTVCTPLAVTATSALKLAQCLLPPESPAMFSGHPCLTGTIAANESQPFNDNFKLTGQIAAFAEKASATDYTCRPPRIGVPGGLAYRRCNDSDRTFADYRPGSPMPNEICGLAGGKKFDLCVATGNFDGCLAGAVQRGNRASCSADHFCRDDYMCQAFPADTPGVKKIKGVGFCSPTYFLFQMRVDNHTTPWKSRERSQYRSVESGSVNEDDDW